MVYSFSLPAGETCPGKTTLCAKWCYGMRGYYCMPSTEQSLQRFYRESKKRGFAKQITHEIRAAHAKTMRVHSNGDFYDAEYIRKWLQIAKRLPGTTFYAYTRTWRCAEKLDALIALARLPNFHMWWSCDAETHIMNGRPPRVKGVRCAYMSVLDTEPIPAYIDLVFRVHRKTVEKFRQGRLICPAENGIKYAYKMTCSDCKLCFRDRAVPRKARTYGQCLAYA